MTAPSTPWILLVDDQEDVRLALRLLLKSEGYACATADSPEEALQQAERREFALAIVDMNYRRDTTSGDEGLRLVRRLIGVAPNLPVVAMTAWGSTELVVSALQAGARDFIEKPWDNRRLLSIVRNQLERARSEQREGAWRLAATPAQERDEAAFESPAMRQVMDVVARVAPTDASVLLLGENGTGKSMLAEAIHRRSARSARPLVRVDMGALTDTLFESEMFGHVRGAFTDAKFDRAGRFEAADGGTLFLDEIGNIPLAQQPKLLRVLESGEYARVGATQSRRSDARLVCATNADIDKEVAAGRFRQDLLYRLNTLVIRVPPLRDRREDILPLARRFLERAAQRYRRSVPTMSDAVERALVKYPWPGNVRELEHAMERVVLVGDGDAIDVDALGIAIMRPVAPPVPVDSPEAHALEVLSAHPLEHVEAMLVARAMLRFDGNVQRAAEALGITRQALYRRLGKVGRP